MKDKYRGTVKVFLTVGFGNNLFQYIYARLLSEAHNSRLSIIFASDIECYHNDLLKMGIENTNYELSDLPTIDISDKNASRDYFGEEYHNHNFILRGYFEDYLLYKDDLCKIRSWFPSIEKTNNDDLVFHLRLGDRIFFANSYNPGMKVEPNEFLKAIKQFSYNRLHIVTDMHTWSCVTKEQVSKMKFHICGVGGTERTDTLKDLQIAANYINSLVESFATLNPLVRINNSVADDFNFIRSFDNILLQHGTLAWWAAAISYASKVGVYSPWRPSKGKKNKNLGQTDFPGWFGWGDYKKYENEE